MQVFTGNSDSTTTVLTSFWDPVEAQVVRVHPLGAATPDGSTKYALARVGVATCHEGRNLTNLWLILYYIMARGPWPLLEWLKALNILKRNCIICKFLTPYAPSSNGGLSQNALLQRC